MFIAHVRTTIDGNPEDITYTCNQHSKHELIRLLWRFQSHYNELNPHNPIHFQLLSISDLSESVTLQDILKLGVTELTRTHVDELLAECRKRRSQHSFTQKLSEDVLKPLEINWDAINPDIKIPPATFDEGVTGE